MKITILGCGTSSGVPTITCDCKTCTSINPKDNRLRCSILIQTENQKNIVIDSSPDFRQQVLRYKIPKIDSLIFTHPHFDHIGGFDDIRPFNYKFGTIPIYANQITLDGLKSTFKYAFETPFQTGGGVPEVEINIINEEQQFSIDGIEFTPILLKHGKMDVLGFRINDFAYCTDVNFISETSMNKLQNLDVLILDALRFEKHNTHFTVDEALEIIRILKPKKSYLTHLSHQINYDELSEKLPENVFLCYDGLILDIK